MTSVCVSVPVLTLHSTSKEDKLIAHQQWNNTERSRSPKKKLHSKALPKKISPTGKKKQRNFEEYYNPVSSSLLSGLAQFPPSCRVDLPSFSPGWVLCTSLMRTRCSPGNWQTSYLFLYTRFFASFYFKPLEFFSPPSCFLLWAFNIGGDKCLSLLPLDKVFRISVKHIVLDKAKHWSISHLHFYEWNFQYQKYNFFNFLMQVPLTFTNNVHLFDSHVRVTVLSLSVDTIWPHNSCRRWLHLIKQLLCLQLRIIKSLGQCTYV